MIPCPACGKPQHSGPCDSSFDYISIQQASSLTDIAEVTLRRWIREGKLPVYGRPRCLKVRISELLPRHIPGSQFKRNQQGSGTV